MNLTNFRPSRRVIALVAITLISVILILPLFTQPSSPLVRQLVVREKPLPSDAIVVLLGGAALERIELGLNLLNQGLAPRIIFCDGFEVSGWKSWWYHKKGWIPFGKNYRLFLHRHDVREDAFRMISCPKIEDTASEIAKIASYLSDARSKRIILVTSASHSRRSNLIWKRLVPSISVTTVAARDSGLQWWWKTRRGRTTIFYEYLALAKELVRTHIGF